MRSALVTRKRTRPLILMASIRHTKTAILAALAFGIAPDMENLPTEGIRNIAPVDIDYAKELGYRIKLLGVARKTEDGVETRVRPAMVPLEAPLAKVMDAINAVVVQGDFVGQTVYEGAGAWRGADSLRCCG